MWEDKWWTFSLEEVLLIWIMDWYFDQKQWLNKTPEWWICFLQTYSFSVYIVMWITVDYFDAFISCLNSHSDGTHSLQRIHWWESNVMLHFSKSVPMKKQTHLHLGWPEEEYIFSKFSFLGELLLWIDCHVRNLPPTVHHYSHQVVQSLRVGSITRGVKEPQLQREDYTIRELGVAMKLVHILKAL